MGSVDNATNNLGMTPRDYANNLFLENYDSGVNNTVYGKINNIVSPLNVFAKIIILSW